jgi:chitin synthase
MEYKFSHFIDKAFEGCFSYQSVLPGAFSVLRWAAVRGSPVEEFLKGLNKRELNLLQLNMFLAEDRIMCFEIVKQRFELLYLPGAVAVTDPPPNLLRLM